MDAMTDPKQIARAFFQMIVQGQIDEAYDKYVDMSGKHHNLFYPAGFNALKNGMIENHRQFPNKKLTIKHVICEGDFVSLHSHLTLAPGQEAIVTHWVRIQNGKIVEMWDCGQPVPAQSPNSDGAF